MSAPNYMPQPGDILVLTVVSPLYRNIYKSEVLTNDKNNLIISMPVSEGKLALISVGTPIEVTCTRNGYTFSSEVTDRSFTPNARLTICLPIQYSSNDNKGPSVIAITSGKGGVGKTTFTINLAISMAQTGKRVFIIDADLGTANVDILLNLQPKFNLNHVVNREKELLDIIVHGPGGIFVVPGGSGLQNLANMEQWQFNRLLTGLQSLEQYADIILIDTGAGLSKNVINFALSANKIIILTTPEPHAITDAYAIMKVLDEQRDKPSPYLVLNRVESAKEYDAVSEKILHVVDRFLDLKIQPLGYILEDPAVPKSNRKLEPFMLHYPDAPASRCINAIGAKLLSPEKEALSIPTGYNFFNKIKELFSR